jgi:uncharacterized protein (TIGR03435 family)
MKPDQQNIDNVLRESWSSASIKQVDVASQRVLQRLRSHTDARTDDPIEHEPRVFSRWRWIAAASAAAVLATIVAVTMNIRRNSTVLAAVEAPDGSLFRLHQMNREPLTSGAGVHDGDVLQAQEIPTPGAFLHLADGSRIEMRSQSELSLQVADDGLRVRLNSGSVIVSAAKQRTGHLYVRTPDLIASVVGTLFLINAAEEGSRVAVIEGEVHVQQGAIATKLRQGEQLTSNPSMSARPIAEEIAWSRSAETHLALLRRQSAASATQTQSTRLEFAAVSIKPNVRNGASGGYQFVAGGANGASWGFGCHGTDGVLRAIFGTGPEIPTPLGRCVGNGVSVARLVTYAYGVPWRQSPALPDWARYDVGPIPGEWFQLDAVAENPSTVTTAQLRSMLQTMLADRFKLKTHREPQQVQGYALTVARSGAKLKQVTGDEEAPALALLGGNPGIKGRSSLEKLALFLTQFVNGDPIEIPFVDRTGLTGIYEYEFPISLSRGGQRGAAQPLAGPPPVQSRPERMTEAAANLSGAMEDRLGLRLQPEKLPVEVVVIDQVEKPSPN